MLTSLSLSVLSEEAIAAFLQKNSGFFGAFAAAVVGSIIFLPGFVAFPLAGVLREAGSSYFLLSAFTTTLMMVGVLTFPIEKEYLGIKITILRNIVAFCIAITIALITGLYFGEIL
ncbi:MAG: hypothetical protein ACLFR1_09260 [Spirochaetia bacterium]